MKKEITRLSLLLLTVLLVFAGCGKDDFDEDLLIGSWSTSTWSYIFYDDYTGSRTQQGRTQTFTWSLDGDELELKFDKYEEGQSQIVTFTVFIIEELKETRMEVYDLADSSKSIIIFTKNK